MDSVSMRAHVFRLWHFFFNGYSVSFGRRPTFKVCFICSGHAHSSASCAGKLLVDVFFFFFFQIRRGKVSYSCWLCAS